jgi:hypothetical protein
MANSANIGRFAYAKRFLGFTFERESKWLVLLYIALPLLAILLAIVIPGLLRRWFS